jgi:hypothetical protein
MTANNTNETRMSEVYPVAGALFNAINCEDRLDMWQLETTFHGKYLAHKATGYDIKYSQDTDICGKITFKVLGNFKEWMSKETFRWLNNDVERLVKALEDAEANTKALAVREAAEASIARCFMAKEAALAGKAAVPSVKPFVDHAEPTLIAYAETSYKEMYERLVAVLKFEPNTHHNTVVSESAMLRDNLVNARKAVLAALGMEACPTPMLVVKLRTMKADSDKDGMQENAAAEGLRLAQMEKTRYKGYWDAVREHLANRHGTVEEIIEQLRCWGREVMKLKVSFEEQTKDHQAIKIYKNELLEKLHGEMQAKELSQTENYKLVNRIRELEANRGVL